MIFISLIVFLLGAWVMPWWHIFPLSFALAWILPQRRADVLQVALAAGISWYAVAFIRNAMASGLIVERMAGLFSLTSELLIYPAMFALAFVSAGLWFQTGRVFSKRS